MRFIKLTLFCMFLSVSNGQNYGLATLWENNSGLRSGDYGVQSVLTPNDVYYELGVEIDNSGNHSLTLVRFEEGDPIWSTTILTSNLVGYTPTKLIFKNGTLYGAAHQIDNGIHRSFLFSISESGQINWQQTSIADNIVTDMLVNPTINELILVGSTYSALTLSRDAFIEARNLDGDLNWRQEMDQYGFIDIATKVSLDGANYLVLGSSESGSQQWEMGSWYYRNDGVLTSFVSGSAVSNNLEKLTDGTLTSGGVTLVGESSTSNQKDFAVYSYDYNHTLLWSDSYDRQGLDDFATSILISSTGKTLVGGTAESSITRKDILVRSYSSNGSLLWSSVVDINEEDDVVVDIIEDVEGNILILSNSQRQGQNDVILLSLNPINGAEQWRSRISSSGLDNDYATKLHISHEGEVWVSYQQNASNSLVVLAYEELMFPNDFEPLSRSNLFIENRGQLKDVNNDPVNSVRFYSQGNPVPYFFADDRIIALQANYNSNPASQRVDFSFTGGNENPVTAVEPSRTETYFNIHEDAESYETCETYKLLSYPNLYPNIDAYVSSNSEGLKLSFLLTEGAQLGDIQIKIEGASSSTIQGGDLVVQTVDKNLGFISPYSYNNEGSLLNDGCIEYNLVDDILTLRTTTCEISYPYVIHLRSGIGQQNNALAIDNMGWSTFFGGFRSESGNDMVIDQSNGDIFIAGSSESTDLPSTPGIGPLSNPKLRGLVLKFDNNAELKWGFIQGAANGPASSLGHLTFKAIDLDDNLSIPGTEIHLVGEYNGNLSPEAPPSAIPAGAYQQQNGAISGNISGRSPYTYDRDLVIVSLNSAGTRIFRTPFGGNGLEKVHTAEVRNGHFYFAGSTDNGSSASSSSSLPPLTHVFPVYNPSDGSFFRAVHPSPGNDRAFVTALDLSTYQLSYSSIITKSSATNSDYTAIYSIKGDFYAGKSLNGARQGAFDNSRMFSGGLNYANSEDPSRDYYSDLVVGTSPQGDVDLYHFGILSNGSNPPLGSIPFNNSYNSTTGQAYVIKRRESAVNWDTYFGPGSGQSINWNYTGGFGGPYFEIPDSKGSMAYSNSSSTLFIAASCSGNAPTQAFPGYFLENVNNNSFGTRADIYIAAFSSNSSNRSNYFNWGTMYGESGGTSGGFGDFYGMDFLSDLELYSNGTDEFLYVLATTGSEAGTTTSNVEKFPVADLGLPNSYFQQQGGGLYDIALTRFKVTDIDNGLHSKEHTARKKVISIYPNPNNGHFIVAPINGEKIREVSVYSMQGALIKEWKLLDSKVSVELNLDGIPKGVYIIKVNQKHGQQLVID